MNVHDLNIEVCAERLLQYKTSERAGRRIAKKCAGADLAALFPGDCGTAASPDALTACATGRALCGVCRAAADAHGVELDCDLVDDASANGSCGP